MVLGGWGFRGGSLRPQRGGILELILENWTLAVADFRREYGINLEERFGDRSFSWFEFQQLAAGLSGESRLARVVSEFMGDATNYISDPKAAEQALEAFMGSS